MSEDDALMHLMRPCLVAGLQGSRDDTPEGTLTKSSSILKTSTLIVDEADGSQSLEHCHPAGPR